MSFLAPYMRERETITSINVELGSCDDSISETGRDPEIIVGSSLEEKEQPSPGEIRPTPKRFIQKRKHPTETASSKLLDFILKERKAEKPDNEIDLFFKSLAETVKKLSPFNQSLAKSRIFAVVSELEMEEISQKILQPAVSTSLQQPRSLSNSSTENPIMQAPLLVVSSPVPVPKSRLITITPSPARSSPSLTPSPTPAPPRFFSSISQLKQQKSINITQPVAKIPSKVTRPQKIPVETQPGPSHLTRNESILSEEEHDNIAKIFTDFTSTLSDDEY